LANGGAVAAQLHAAPAAGGVFCAVVKMQDAAFARAQATRIETGEHLGGRMQQRREKILGFPRLKAVRLCKVPLKTTNRTGSACWASND